VTKLKLATKQETSAASGIVTGHWLMEDQSWGINTHHVFQFLYKKGNIVYPYRSTGGPEGESSDWIRRSPCVQKEMPMLEQDLLYVIHTEARSGDMKGEAEGCYEASVRPTYRFWDPYDWHKGLAAGGGVPGLARFEDEWAAALHDAGLAQEYEISGYWLGPVKVYTFPSNWLALDIPQAPISVRPGRWSD
jgi:hypothetical protein